MYYYNQPLLRTPSTNHIDSKQDKIIKVFGEGTVFVQPDVALVTVGVITESKLLTKAQEENNVTTSNVIEALMKQGLTKEDIKTVNYTIDMQYDYHEGKQIFRGYKVTHLLQLTIKQIRKTGSLVDTAVANGANQVSNIQFTISDPSPFYNEALVLALRNGQEKAKTIATSLNLKWRNTPSKITETTQINIPPIPFQAGFALKSEATPIQTGELKITARIDAEYNLYP